MDFVSNTRLSEVMASSLVEREAICDKARVAIARTLMGNPSQSLLLVGAQKVEKVMMLDQVGLIAEDLKAHVLRVNLSKSRPLPSIIAPLLRKFLVEISNAEGAVDAVAEAMRALVGFSRALRYKYPDLEELTLDAQYEEGLADSGDLAMDLQDLIVATAVAAREAKTCICILVDELQSVAEDELSALVVSLHCASQRRLPVILVGSGLPQLPGKMGSIKSYSERLFEFLYL